ncbi:MAG TPA: hypothetical protein VLH56_07865 [Dissulfurispiraceae bacterium]|nr:hypothetical protein [Dissulfurispiraceae bacterium]
MKKAVLLLLSAVLVVSVAACSDKKEEPIIPRTAAIPQQQPSQPVQPAQAPLMPASHPPVEKSAGPMTGSPHGAAVEKSEKKVVVPDAVKKSWSKVRLQLVEKATGAKKDIVASLGKEMSLEGTPLTIKVGEFLPDFTMAGAEITSRSNEPKQPAVRIEIYEQGKLVHKGWIFAKMPDVHPFEHQKYGLLLKDGVK